MFFFLLVLTILIVWGAAFIKFMPQEGGLSFYFKNLGIVLLIATCISAVAYVLGGFYCAENSRCEERFMGRSILIDCIILGVWAIMLLVKKPKLRPVSSDILDDGY